MPPPIPYMGIYIDRSAEDVFAYVIDIARTTEWRPRMSAVGWTTRRELGVGSGFRVTVKSLGYSFHFELEITEWDPPRYFAYSGRQGPIVTNSFMGCLPDGNGCRFFTGGDPRSTNWLVRILRPLFEASLIRQNLGDLERLRGIMESGLDRSQPR